ncbi:fibronectin type III domain-containing protein [Bacillus luteolus]|uniref:Fibronectin type III domain-containing protein n=1 Tax=Litchfieldia luteola TaxID=682179 RepID=A0ABR9QEW8_9BACI|nr:fibronectin type III domain-containing protein [Cytobacillus luteolus]MBE4907044.1 fibronectin type III domain-containing protein [Cytobacillus luteolus]MBP1943489.1 hypothetical protein [Cytobacillus luteolus]
MNKQAFRMWTFVVMLVIVSQASLMPASKTVAETMNTLQPPSNVTLSIENENDIVLRWSPVLYATGYKIYQIIDGQAVLVRTTTGIAALFSNMPAGEYSYTVHSYSSSLGESGPSKIVTNVSNKDTEAPVTRSTANENWLTQDTVIELFATDNESGVANTYYSINKGAFREGSVFTLTEEGINNVYFYSVDNVGNIEKIQTQEVKIDKTQPELSIDLQDVYSLGAEVVLTYHADDKVSGISSAELTVNGQVIENGGSFKFDQPGEYLVKIEAEDHAGWKSTYEKKVIVQIPVSIEVTPGILKDNNGLFTVKVYLPDVLTMKDIDLNSVTLNGVSAKSGTEGLQEQAELGQFKFKREDFDLVSGEVTLEFRASLGDHDIVGKAVVKVK